MASYAMENPIFSKTVSTKSIKIGERYLTNHNKLLWRVDGADGVKTGYTQAAGRVLVSSASRQGRRLIAVTIDAPDDWNDHASLLENGFSRYSTRRIVNSGECVGILDVVGGESCRVEVLAAEDLDYPVAPEENPQLVLPGKDFIYAPVVEGAEAGIAYVVIEGNAVAKLSLVFGRTIEMEKEERTFFRTMIDRITTG